MKVTSLVIGLLGSFFMQLSSLYPQEMWADFSLDDLLENRDVLSERALIFDEFHLGTYADGIPNN